MADNKHLIKRMRWFIEEMLGLEILELSDGSVWFEGDYAEAANKLKKRGRNVR